MSLVGYARVSTDSQDLGSQIAELERAGALRVFSEVASTRKSRLPERDACLAFLRPGDTLVVTWLDRLDRSLRAIVNLVDDLAAQDVSVVALHQGIDTRGPTGPVVIAVFAAIAEAERTLISERTKAGLAYVRDQGQTLGRPRALTAEQSRSVVASHEAGATVASLARQFGVSRRTIDRALELAAEGDARVVEYRVKEGEGHG